MTRCGCAGASLPRSLDGGAVLAQACLLSLVARYVIGTEAAALPDLATCFYGLAVGTGMLCLRPLAEAAITAP